MTQPQQPPNPYVPPPPSVPPTVPAPAPAPAPAQPNPWAAPPQDAVPPYPGQPAPAPPYGAPPYGAPQYGAPQSGYSYPPAAPGYGYPPMVACRVCGGIPAANVTVRGQQGLLIWSRFLYNRGPFCQVCGIATVRAMSERTLWFGWWSWLSALVTPITLISNRIVYGKIRRLPAPQPGSHGPQLDPGRPLTKRPAISMLLLPVVAAAVVVAAVVANSGNDSITGADVTTAQAGDCIHDSNASGGANDAHASVTVVPCSSSQADYQVVARVASMADDGSVACAPYSRATHWFTHQNAANSFVLCLAAPGTVDTSGGSGGSSGSTGSTGSDSGSAAT